MEMQQNGVQNAYKYMYHKKKLFCHFTQYYNEYSTQKQKSVVAWGTHTICYQTTFLAGSKELNLVSKK